MRAAVVGICGPVLTDAEARLFAEARPCGVILFRRNVQDPAQLAALGAALRGVLADSAVLMVDQEGGRVARLRPPHWLAHPPAAVIGARYLQDPGAGLRAAWLTGALIGAQCAAAGIDVACAPVLDLRVPAAHEVIGDRAFGEAPEAVAALGAAMAEGLLAAGVQPVAKHAPGHGRAAVDSHLDLPVVHATALNADIAPFAANASLPWMMTAHIVYPLWDAKRPATLSPAVIGAIIRGQIGFDGVLVSDDLAMHALRGAPAELARQALAAGCDVALHCTGDPADTEALLKDCPTLTPLAIERLGRARALAAQRRSTLDTEALAAERTRLLA